MLVFANSNPHKYRFCAGHLACAAGITVGLPQRETLPQHGTRMDL